MVLKKITILAPAGGYFVTHSELAYANVLSVNREGNQYYLVSDLPTGLLPNVKHDAAEGKLYFSQENPFDSNTDEKIFVIYTNGGIVDAPPVEEPEIINGDISNNSYPSSGNQIDAILFDGVGIAVGTPPGFVAASFPVAETPGSTYRLFKVGNPGINKQLSISVTSITGRQIIVIDSAGLSQSIGLATTGTHLINNVSIFGSMNCRIIMN